MSAIIPAELAKELRERLDAAISPHLAAKREEYAAAAQIAVEITVTDDESLAAANECLRLVVVEKDGLEAVRKAGPGALDSIVRALNAKFKPLRDVLEGAEANLKRAIGAYTLRQRQIQIEAQQIAAQAHAQGAHDVARGALAVASTAITEAPTGTGVREVWAVKRIAADLLPREWLIPNEAAIAKHARDTPADRDPTPIPGVIFERQPIVTVRR
jgi:hypothetical protein